MINITVRYQSKGQFVSLTSRGHADSAPHGQDLVCAAVSGILLGGINALSEKACELKADENKGIIEMSAIGKLSEHDEIVVETIVKQLQAIARDNPKFMRISIE